ncbi:MAG TPA: sulfite exporter TauE/SafE family protein [Thermoleophilaceae bacterium]|nr:sulfite exporter TauE/SafE family protein [Thermoleophilaceae bacterium]
MAAVVVGMAVQASVGFGFGFFVAPAALGAFRPAQAVTLLLLLALLINSLILYSEGRKREIDASAAALLCAWALPGIVAGALVVRDINAHVLQVAIGVGIVAAALLQARASNASADAPRGPHPGGTLAAGGACAGVLTTATSLNGPVVVLTFTRAGLRGHVLRDTGAAAFLVLALAGTAALATIAHAGRALPHWPLLVALAAAAVVGHRFGAALFHRLDAERHRRLVLGAAAVAGTVSIVAGLV